MACWNWFNNVLAEAGVEVTEENRDRIDSVIEQYLLEGSASGRCSRIPAEASHQISRNSTLRQELMDRLRDAAGP